MNTALDQFAIPGDASFPLNQAFEAPRDRQEAEVLRQYLSQVRQELAMRLLQRVYAGGSGAPSKVRFFVRRWGVGDDVGMVHGLIRVVDSGG